MRGRPRSLYGSASLFGILFIVFLPGVVHAEEIGGVEFPLGERSFADQVVSYSPGTDVEAPHDQPSNALGVPDYPNPEEQTALGNSTSECEAELVVEFRDNYLIDVEGLDLWIFEIGPAVEATEVFITYGDDPWTRIGRIEGATRGIDIHSWVEPGEKFTRVRLCDWPGNITSRAPYGGPDIDAVGAIGAGPRPDSDGDELRDDEELLFFTDPFNPDTDGDGVNDGTEVANQTDPLTPSGPVSTAGAPVGAQPTGGTEEESADTPSDATTGLTGLTAAAAAILIAAAMVRSNPPAATGWRPAEILDGTQAVQHLIDGEVDIVTINGRDYILPLRRLPSNTNGVAYETITVGDTEVIDPDRLAIATTPVEPLSEIPDETPPAIDASPVRITEDEIDHIVDWGVRNQRSLADIQRDIDARNETLGGSGHVPIANPPGEFELERGGSVVLDAAEAREYGRLREEMEMHRAASWTWREALRILSGQSMAQAGAHTQVAARWLSGVNQLLEQVSRYHEAPQVIGASYGRPTLMSYDTDRYWRLEDAVEAWEQSYDGQQALEEINQAQVECIENIQSMTSRDPEGELSWFNCTSEELERIERTQARLTEELRALNQRAADLREMERRFAERIQGE